jgi:Universal stress protein family
VDRERSWYPLRGDRLTYRHRDYEAAEYVHARALLQAAREEAGVRGELRWSPCTPPGRGLHELAEMLGSDLLVVGSCERGLFGRVMVGNDTRAALDGAPCAVAIAPAGYAEHPAPIGKIGVAYDGSPDSGRRSKGPEASPISSARAWPHSRWCRSRRGCSAFRVPATTPRSEN